MKLASCVLLLVGAAALATAQSSSQTCSPVGGILFTNVGAIQNSINLGVVYGDLSGTVAAAIISGPQTIGFPASGKQQLQFTVQHYWVTAAGDTILLKQAILIPTYPVFTAMVNNKSIVAVPWGNYISDISGGTGKFEGATGSLSYFGMADFVKNTLVLRYSGKVCFKQ